MNYGLVKESLASKIGSPDIVHEGFTLVAWLNPEAEVDNIYKSYDNTFLDPMFQIIVPSSTQNSCA